MGGLGNCMPVLKTVVFGAALDGVGIERRALITIEPHGLMRISDTSFEKEHYKVRLDGIIYAPYVLETGNQKWLSVSRHGQCHIHCFPPAHPTKHDGNRACVKHCSLRDGNCDCEILKRLDCFKQGNG